jgi:hypothetical protein
VNKAVAVRAIMNDLIVSEPTFYRKNPDHLAGAANMICGGTSQAVTREGDYHRVLYFLAESSAWCRVPSAGVVPLQSTLSGRGSAW